MIEFQRMTTEYLDLEDRLRVTGETRNKEVVEVWLTQRLMLRLLPHVLGWLEKQTLTEIHPTNPNEQTKEMLQTLAQQTARAELKKQGNVRPVKVTATSAGAVDPVKSLSLLIDSVDINRGKEFLQLLFKTKAGEQVRLALRPQPLRQWLAIVRAQWQRAQWPATVWPKWASDSLEAEAIETSQAVH